MTGLQATQEDLLIRPGKGGFVGTRFVKQIFFELSGGQEQWVGPFNQALYDKWAPKVWDS